MKPMPAVAMKDLHGGPLPAPERAAEPLPGPSDWNFELVEQYLDVIRRTAERFGLDTYPNQLEIITAEQMMDAYASVGMPVNYRHWSYGKEFISTEKNYKRGHMGLAYEIVINSNPCISYLMEENSMAMHCIPRHTPNVGMLCSRPYFKEMNLPSIPRFPKPGATTKPSIPANFSSTLLSVICCE